MEQYKLPSHINPDKAFIVCRSELEGRLEPKYYTSIYLENENKLENSSFPLVTIKDVTHIVSDGTHFTPNYVEKGVKFISVKDVRQSAIDLNCSKFITEEEANLLDKRCKPQLNDILLTKVGTIGLAAVIKTEERFQIFVSVALLRPQTSIIPDYLEIVLNSNIAYLQYDRIVKGAGVPDLHLEDIRKVKLPLPSIDIQQQIVDLYHEAYSQNQQKGADAKALLDSIDSYLLDELGITLSEKDNSLQKRVFTTQFCEITGGRLDPFYNKTEFGTALKNIENANFQTKLFKEVITDLKNGVEIRDYNENGTRYLRVTDLSKDGINNNSPRYVDTKIIPAKIKLNKNDLLISRSGSLGLVSIAEDCILDSILSSHIFKVSLKTEVVNSNYLQEYLRSSLGQFQFFRNNNGGVIPEINQNALKSIILVIPPLGKQNEIAQHIQSIREQAKQLQNDAKAVLEQAKKEVELMILG